MFPQAIAWGATFDRGIVGRVADAIALEARARYHAAVAADNRTQYRGLTFWTPNVNLFRDPRWGRGHETYGEDPYLTRVAEHATHQSRYSPSPKTAPAPDPRPPIAAHMGTEEPSKVPDMRDRPWAWSDG